MLLRTHVMETVCWPGGRSTPHRPAGIGMSWCVCPIYPTAVLHHHSYSALALTPLCPLSLLPIQDSLMLAGGCRPVKKRVPSITHTSSLSSFLSSHTSPHTSSSRNGIDQRHDAMRRRKEIHHPTQPHPPATLSSLIRSLNKMRYRQSFAILQQIRHSDLQVLAGLPTQYYTLLLRAIFYNHESASASLVLSERIARLYSLWTLMQTIGIPPELDALLIAVEIHGHMGDITQLNAIYCQIRRRGFNVNNKRVLAAMCRACILCGDTVAGLTYFEKLLRIEKTPFVYNSLISAYAMKGDEQGMFDSLSRMQESNVSMDSFTIGALSQYFITTKSVDAVHAYIRHFKALGGVPGTRLYGIQMRMANHVGHHHNVLSLLDEMRAARIHFDSAVKFEVLIAHAGLGDAKSVWPIYAQLARSMSVSYRVKVALITMLGSFVLEETLDEVRVASLHFSLPPHRTLADLLHGYAIVSDVASACSVISELEKLGDFFTKRYALVIWAYFHSSDANGALEYAKSLSKKNSRVDASVWYAVLVCTMKLNPGAINKVIDYIQNQYPEVAIEELLGRARARVLIERVSSSSRLAGHFDE
ncbi:hypothetical protein BASA50_009596 [Batrachochytrium salamandrivorans]|uniref:Pentacotripeptide-repeat region of PRORP domain-containing protein n=1 Tax=Batrachochytrium salamandrivorans TaxID=1357716 RepID=A0ABQ8F223_9FUNG|nr:hypothetical protein BASA62_005247 [Batrachochytrium salamandrivorans]KAH6590182.1 hypothetical protein BASA50_009596 [Batrachochytrium salamandrivorans]